jgi:plasmid stabilization system protein ParE
MDEQRIKVIWAPSADRDLGRIFEHLRIRGPDTARRTLSRLTEAVDRLESHPEIGAVAEDVKPLGRCRQLAVPPFRILYTVTDTNVYVLRIWDSRRDPKGLTVPNVPEDDDED